MIKISSNSCQATFSEQGAELISLQTNSGTEYIWQADPAHWKRHAPILFPIVGRLERDTFRFKNSTYHLPQHGFARDQLFEVIQKDESNVTFSLSSDHNTRKVFPFHFELIITYSLQNEELSVEYKAVNKDDQQIYFSIGAHPAFNCPLYQGTAKNEYSLVLDGPKTIERIPIISEGLLQNRSIPFIQHRDTISIDDDLFDEGAIVIKDPPINEIGLAYQGKVYISMLVRNFPYLGIWSPSKDAPFVCIEPWHGIADREGFVGELQEKEGILCLDVNRTFTCEYVIKIHN